MRHRIYLRRPYWNWKNSKWFRITLYRSLSKWWGGYNVGVSVNISKHWQLCVFLSSLPGSSSLITYLSYGIISESPTEWDVLDTLSFNVRCKMRAILNVKGHWLLLKFSPRTPCLKFRCVDQYITASPEDSLQSIKFQVCLNTDYLLSQKMHSCCCNVLMHSKVELRHWL